MSHSQGILRDNNSKKATTMATIRKRGKAHGTAFQAIVRMRGVVKTETFQRLTDAKDWAAKVEAEIRAGRAHLVTEQDRHSVADAIDRYSNRPMAKPLSARHSQDGHLLWWKNHIGRLPLDRVTSAVLVECRDKLLAEARPNGETRSRATVNRYLTTFLRILNLAESEWGWRVGDTRRLKLKLREPSGRTRYLSGPEREALLGCCADSFHPDLLDIVQLALGTGMRQGEILNLEWGNIHFDRKVVVLAPEQTKNRQSRTIPLHGASLLALERRSKLRRIDTALVFPAPPRGRTAPHPTCIRHAWDDALERSGVQDFRFHDLRHSFASYLAMSGASLLELADLMGHKTLAMVKRYAHLSPEHGQELVARMHSRFLKEA